MTGVSTKAKIWPALTALLVSSALSLLFVEFLFRLYQSNKAVTPIGVESHTNDLVDFYQRDSVTGWSNRPLSKGTFSVGTCVGKIEFDAEGERVGTNPPEYGPDVPTVLFIGDSVLAGFEVDGNETSAAYARQEFQRRGLKVRVINGGVRGYNDIQMVRNMERLIEKYHPIHVVVFSGGNDVWENVWPQMPFLDSDGHVFAPAVRLKDAPPYEILAAPTFNQLLSYYGLPNRPVILRMFEREVPIIRHFRFLERLLETITFPVRRTFQNEFFASVYAAAHNPSQDLSATESALFRIWENSLEAIAESTIRHGVDLTLSMDMLIAPAENRYDDIMERVARKTGVRHFRIKQPFAALFDHKQKECESDGHPVPYENKLIGTIVTNDIEPSVRAKISHRQVLK